MKGTVVVTEHKACKMHNDTLEIRIRSTMLEIMLFFSIEKCLILIFLHCFRRKKCVPYSCREIGKLNKSNKVSKTKKHGS